MDDPVYRSGKGDMPSTAPDSFAGPLSESRPSGTQTGRTEPTEEQMFLGACAIERELRRWGHEPPSESVLRLCAARSIEAYLLNPTK